MVVEGFDEICNFIYIAKMLHGIGRDDLIESSLSDEWEYDNYYADMYDLLDNLFEYHRGNYYDYRCMEVHVLSDSVIVDFYKYAGVFGRRCGIPDSDNEFIKEAEYQTELNLGFSYALDWKLMGYTNPVRPFHSRLGLFIAQDAGFDMGFLLYRLMELYKWFQKAREDLYDMLYGSVIKNQISLGEVDKAA